MFKKAFFIVTAFVCIAGYSQTAGSADFQIKDTYSININPDIFDKETSLLSPLEKIIAGIKLYHKKQYETARKMFEDAAKENNYLANYFLGLMQYSGKGIKKNTEKALANFDLACRHNIKPACSLLKKIQGSESDSKKVESVKMRLDEIEETLKMLHQ